jgi:hypothetical protein
MSSEQGPRLRGCERPRVLPAADALLVAPHFILGGGSMSSEQGPRIAGMRTSASAGGSLRSNGVPTGLLLARVAASLRYSTRNKPTHLKEKAA